MKGGRLVGLAAAALLSCASAPRPGAVPEGGAISRLATGPAAALPPADAKPVQEALAAARATEKDPLLLRMRAP